MLKYDQNNVQSKITCIFVTDIKQLQSSKRQGQNYNVTATAVLTSNAVSSEIDSATSSEKLDGTCTYISKYCDRLTLWARLDRKLNKQANKKFKDFLHKEKEWKKAGRAEPQPVFNFRYPDDLKKVPDSWIPALLVERNRETGGVIPDNNGHVPGWVPIESDPKQYCWHHTVVYEEFILVVKESSVDVVGSSAMKSLFLSVEPMSNYEGRTLELIGTNVNGNPYGFGTKQKPFHVLVAHGSIPVVGLPSAVDYQKLYDWFTDDDVASGHGGIEGIVWHCHNGKMFKLHRHHMGLTWPLNRSKPDGSGQIRSKVPQLSRRSVTVSSELMRNIDDDKLAGHPLLRFVKSIHLKTFTSLLELCAELS